MEEAEMSFGKNNVTFLVTAIWREKCSDMSG